MKKHMVNIPVSFNCSNLSHVDLLSWIDKQTTNRSSFIRETIMMRKCGLFGSQKVVLHECINDEMSFDIEEALKIIQI